MRFLPITLLPLWKGENRFITKKDLVSRKIFYLVTFDLEERVYIQAGFACVKAAFRAKL